MLTEIHSGHPGLNSCVKRAKQSLFWINMASDIQELVDGCQICQKHQRENIKQTIVSKEIPSLPFERVATDLFYFKGKDYILLVDSYSSFFDFKMLPDTSSRAAIAALKGWFAVHGIPRVLESDNGPQYSSDEFRAFAAKWSFDHETSSPHFPRANGLAERYVQTAKVMLKKCAEDQLNVRALLHARNTPRSTGLPSPSERLMGRVVRTTLPVSGAKLQPRLLTGVPEVLAEERQQQKRYADCARYEPGDIVLLQNCKMKTWKPATVVNCVDGRRSYVVTNGESVLRRNAHHLRPTKAVEDNSAAEGQQESEDQQPVSEEHSQTATETTTGLPEDNRVLPQQSEETHTLNNQPRTTRSGRPVKQLRFSDYEYY